MKKRKVAFLMCLALAATTLAGCGSGSDSSGSTTAAAENKTEETTVAEAEGAGETEAVTSTSTEIEYKGTVKLGGLAPLTGNYAEYGTGFQIGWNKAIEEINAAGGANGYKLELQIQDSEGDSVVSTTLFTGYAEDDNIMAVLGDFTSGACIANAEIAERYGIVELSPTASSDSYASSSEYCFGIMGRQDVEAPFLAKYILASYLGVNKIGVIRIDSDWGLSCYNNFITQAEKEGLDVVVETYADGETDFSSVLTKMQSENPDVLVVMDQGSAVAQIFNQADAMGWEIQHVALGPGTSEQVANQLLDQDNLIVTSPFFFDPEDETLTAWSEWFTSEAGFAPTIHPACAYDTVYLIAEAIKYIDDEEITRDAIKDALQNMDAYEGLTGTIVFSEDGDIRRNYLICGLVDGKWTILEGFEYGAAGL